MFPEMADVPSGCPSAKQFSNYLHERVRECILRYMSKKETVTHLRDRYQIAYGFTVLAWCNIERSNQEFFRTYFEDGVPNEKARAKMGKVTDLSQIEEDTGSYLPPKGDSNKAPSSFSDTRSKEQKQQREKEQQLIETVRNILSKVPQEDANAHDGNPKVIVEQSSIKAGESQARQKQTLQATRQQLTFPTLEYWNKLLTSLGRIQSNTDQMVKLMTDAPHPSSPARSFKRQRVEPEKEGSEAKKLQDQNIQLQQGKSRGNKAAKID